MNLSRRKFLIKSGAGAAALASIPSIVTASVSSSQSKKIHFEKDSIVLFQGD